MFFVQDNEKGLWTYEKVCFENEVFKVNWELKMMNDPTADFKNLLPPFQKTPKDPHSIRLSNKLEQKKS